MRPEFFSRGVNEQLEGSVAITTDPNKVAANDALASDATPQDAYEQIKSTTIDGATGRMLRVTKVEMLADINGSVLATGDFIRVDVGYSIELVGAAAKTGPDQSGTAKQYTSDGGPQTFLGCQDPVGYGPQSYDLQALQGTWGDGIIVRFWIRKQGSVGHTVTSYCMNNARVTYDEVRLVQHRGAGW